MKYEVLRCEVCNTQIRNIDTEKENWVSIYSSSASNVSVSNVVIEKGVGCGTKKEAFPRLDFCGPGHMAEFFDTGKNTWWSDIIKKK